MKSTTKFVTVTLCIIVTILAFSIGSSLREFRQEAESPQRKTNDRRPVSTSAPLAAAVEVGIENERFSTIVADEMARVDPSQDGWSTEVFSDGALKQLKALGHIIESAQPDQPIDAAHLVTETFRCTDLRPATEPVFEDSRFTIRRLSVSQASRPLGDTPGPARLHEAITGLTAAFEQANARTKFKVVGVEATPDATIATIYFEVAAGRFAQTATWTCRWLSLPGDEKPRLDEIRVIDYEETFRSEDSPNPLFVDRTDDIFADSPSFTNHLKFGLDHWRARMDQSLGIGLTSYVGLAIGDVNGDMRDDIYVCQSGGLPNRLFVQQPDGTLVDMAADAAVDFLDLTRSALLIDLDNDQDQDLVLAVSSRVLVLENRPTNGRPRFVQRAKLPTGAEIFSLSACDYDGDGDLDIFSCGYASTLVVGGQSTALGLPIPYHDAENGGRNALIQNDIRGAQWRFSDATQRSGLDHNNTRFSLASSWEDYDNDGDLDLYVANDFGRNNLYHNDKGRFVDVAAAAGVEDISAGMSVSWADYDHDGWMDLYVSNMFSAAGNRVAFQRQFKTNSQESDRRHFQRHARGNSLFRNQGDGRFHDESVTAAVTMGRWAWSSNFIDVNNDGWQDVFIANGFMTGADSGDL